MTNARRRIGTSFLDRANELEKVVQEWERDPTQKFQLPRGAAYALEEKCPLLIQGVFYDIVLIKVGKNDTDRIVSLAAR